MAKWDCGASHRHIALRAKREAYAREMASRMTFVECCTQYLDTHLKSFRNEKHRAQWQTSLTRACRAFGDVPVNDMPLMGRTSYGVAAKDQKAYAQALGSR
jgi:hypothetical protein